MFRNEYDIISNKTTKKILAKIIDMLFNGLRNCNFIFEIKELKFGINIETKDTGHTEYNSFPFYIEARTDHYPDTRKSYIILNIYLDNQFSNKNFEQINNDIYKKIRHEIEHVLDFKKGKYPNERYKEIYQKSFEERFGEGAITKEQMLNHIKLVSEYITNETELLAYARSVLYITKKQKKDIQQIIEQILNKSFYNDNREYMLLVRDNKEAQKIINATKEAISDKIREFYPKLIRTYPML